MGSDEISSGDEIIVKLRDRNPIFYYKDGDDRLSFTVVGKTVNDVGTEFLLYVPCYQASRVICSTICKNDILKYSADVKFLNEYGIKVYKSHIDGVNRRDGANCLRCGDFFLMAEKNTSFVCYSCKQNPFR